MTATPGPAVDSAFGAVLFTDLVGFTEYTDTEGDVAALRVLEHQTGLMSGITDARPDARIVKELGDGLLVWFDAALDAIEGAIAMLLAVEAARRTNAFPVAIRMGLHAGEVLPRGPDLVGATVNIAARIAALAGPGELLASEAAVDACGDRLPAARLDPVGPAPVKGVSTPVWLVRVCPDRGAPVAGARH
ncbi:MAG: adenylate/guanylate cyclase domain-containing protein [Acidimicrobiales bacterium]